MEEKNELRKEIELLDGWVCLVDTYSYSLAKKRTNKKGETVYDTKSYHASLCGALNALGGELARESVKNGSQSLVEAVRHISESNARLMEFIQDSFDHIEVHYGK